MKFLAPWFFWSFLSLIPLVAVYFLKVRPRRKQTTAYFLWQKVFTEKKATSLLSRLRDVLSLLLMALVFGGVCLALTKPELQDDTRKDLLILLDQSASMNAGSGAANRMRLAREAAADLIKGLDGSQRAAVAAVAGEVRFLSHLGDDPRAMLDAVEEVRPTSLELQAAALRSLQAGGASGWMAHHRVIFITDGCLGGQAIPENIEILKVGEPLENAGIVSADASYLPGPGGRLGVYFQIASSFKQPVRADLVIKAADEEGIAKLVPLEIKPGLNAAETFTVEEAAPGKWLVQLELKDALGDDNTAYLAVARPKPVRVMVEAQDKFFLETCVEAFAKSGGLLFLAEEEPQLVLSRSRTPAAPLSLIFQPDGASPWWKAVGDAVEAAAPRVRLPEHPALRHLDAAGMAFAGARQMEPADGALVLVETEQKVPLIYTISAGGRAAMVVNMDPVAAELYYSAWFPILVHNAAAHLAGREENLLATYSAGATIPVPGSRDGDLTAITTPDGSGAQTTGKRFGPLAQPGFYSLHNNAGEWLAACSLLAPEETQLDNSAVPSTLQPISRGTPPFLILTIGAIVLLIVESLLYHRRKVG